MEQYKEFEQFTQQVYQRLVNNDVLKPTVVQPNVILTGKSGCKHQIDVYWEYEIAGNMHRVAIECKNYNSLVPVGKVRDFYGVLLDLNNVNGIMVSRKGYQKGAKQFAAEHGISLKELRRPEWNESIGTITTSVRADVIYTLFLIDEDWAIEHDYNIDGHRRFYAEYQPEKEAYWMKSKHFPIEINDDIIRDSNGKQITSLVELERQQPKPMQPGTEMVFPFEDGWVDSRYWGAIKVREVKYECERDIQETTFKLAATDFVEAILEDAILGRTDYIPI